MLGDCHVIRCGSETITCCGHRYDYLGIRIVGEEHLGMKTLVAHSREVVKDKTFRHENAKTLYVYSDTDNVVGWDVRNVRMTK